MGHMTMSKNRLESSLRTITGLSALEIENAAQSLLYFFPGVSQKGRKCINYLQLYHFYIKYANQKMVPESGHPEAQKNLQLARQFE